MILAAVIITSLVLIIVNLIILLKIKPDEIDSTNISKLNFSILIPFKNEENHLFKMIKSINKLNYPKNNFEIIFINDSSTDNSAELIVNNINTEINYRIIFASKKKLNAKKGALDIGLQLTSNEYIITTDADAELPSDLLIAYSKKFNNNYDIVFGPSHLNNNKTIAGKISQFYNLRNQFLMFGAANFGFPYTAMGSNLAYNKIKFNEIGGYSIFNEVISGDDDLLIREGIKRNFKIGIILSNNYLVKSESVKTIKEFLNQKARHTATSNFYLKRHKAALAIWHYFNILSLFLFLFFFIDNLLVIPLSLKFLFDIILIKSKQKLFDYDFNFLEIILYQTAYEFLLIINYINGSLKRYSWK